MQNIISDTISSAQSAGAMNDVIVGAHGIEGSADILRGCDFCSKIQKYDSVELIQDALLSPELGEAHPLFIQGLREKLKILSRPDEVRESFENYYLNAGVPESLISGELSEELEVLISELEGDTCSMDYIIKIRAFNNAHLGNYDISLTQEDAGSIISSLIDRNKDTNQLAFIDIKYRLTVASGVSPEQIQTYFDIPEEEERNSLLSELLAGITDQEVRETLRAELISHFDFKEEIVAQEERSEMIIEGAAGIYDALWQPSAEYILRRPQDIGMIQDRSVLLELFTGAHREDLKDKIQLGDLYLNFLYDSEIVLNFPGKIEVTEVRLLPDSILSQSSIIIHLIESVIKI